MKDYYYFLGLPIDASAEDIKKAYRKLSLKYHPDRNSDDVFFVERFREAQEAYEALIDPERRRIYDDQLISAQRNVKSKMPPRIQNFNASTIRAFVDEEIKLNWQTYDADLVKIIPFGLEKPSGERRFKIKDFDENGEFRILLHATNTLLQKTVVQGIVIKKRQENNSASDESQEVDYQDEGTVPELKTGLPNKKLLIIALVLGLLIICFLIINNLFN